MTYSLDILSQSVEGVENEYIFQKPIHTLSCRSFILQMLFLLVLVLGIVKTCATQGSTGTTLFYNKHIDADCWSQEEVAKLQARKILNELIPKQTPPTQISKTFLNDALRYYKDVLHTVDKQDHSESKTVLREVLADTIGGHFRSELLPAARLAYYAGYVPYKPVRALHDIYSELKTTLNTEGLGWKTPSKIPPIANLTVIKIVIGQGKLFDPCNLLMIKRDANVCIHIPLPKVDDANEPTAIALPFKNGGLVNLLSPTAENILLKYYTTASRCILRRSPASCRHSDIVNFNNDLWCWMKTKIAPHLMDEKLYAAYGGILRVAAAVQNYGKVLPRRNLFEMCNKPKREWDSWRKITEPYFFIDSDWTPCLYIQVVALAAIAICLLQMCYNYIFGTVNACSCVEKKTSCFREPQHAAPKSAIYHNETQTQRTTCALRSTVHSAFSPVSPDVIKSSHTPVKTQRVYDYNENLLDVIMSDAEEGEYCSSDSNNGYNGKTGNSRNITDATLVARSSSPPKIETPIEQLKIDKGRVGIRGDRVEMRDKWASTEDGSSSCSESASSGSSTSRPRARTRPERTHAHDMAWARHVLAPATAARSRTAEHDSYTTSTSHQ